MRKEGQNPFFQTYNIRDACDAMVPMDRLSNVVVAKQVAMVTFLETCLAGCKVRLIFVMARSKTSASGKVEARLRPA